MYHHILPKEGFIASSIQQFDNQMKYLAENGYYTLSSDEFFLYKKDKLKVPKKSVLITFDDGWRDNFIYAYPILKKYNLKATLFIVTNWIEHASKKNEKFEPMQHKDCKKIAPLQPSKVILSWDEIEKMSDVFDFHSHTHTHRDFYFEKCSWDEEFEKSKEIIKKRLGFESTHLCWPRGKYDKNLIQLGKKFGYEIFYTTKRGININDNSLDEIKRIAIKKDEKWLKKQLTIFSNNFLGSLYAKIKPE